MNYVTPRLQLLKISIVNSYHVQSAYFSENVMGIAAALAYTFSMLVFIKVVFANVDLFAGYTKDEMLFLLFIAQLNYFISYIWSIGNMNSLIESVRTGALDLILIKPVPDLFYVSTRSINILTFLKEGLPTLIVFALAVNWSELDFPVHAILPAIAIAILGQLCVHAFRFLFALPTFFVGNAEQVFKVSGAVTDVAEIPFEGYPFGLRVFFTAFVPALFASQLSVSVALGKSSSLQMLVFSAVITLVFVLLANFGWRMSLKNYTSASS